MVPRFAHTEIPDRLEYLQSVYRGADIQTGDDATIEFLPETSGGYGLAFPMGFCPGRPDTEQEV